MREPVVWVVEDERVISGALQVLLSRAGYAVAIFARGAAFLIVSPHRRWISSYSTSTNGRLVWSTLED